MRSGAGLALRHRVPGPASEDLLVTKGPSFPLRGGSRVGQVQGPSQAWQEPPLLVVRGSQEWRWWSCPWPRVRGSWVSVPTRSVTRCSAPAPLGQRKVLGPHLHSREHQFKRIPIPGGPELTRAVAGRLSRGPLTLGVEVEHGGQLQTLEASHLGPELCDLQ